MEKKLAERLGSIHASAIRGVQKKIAAKEGVISFAAGLPAADLFPVDDFRAATATVFEQSGGQAMQYGMTLGYQPLIDLLVERMQETENIEADAAEIIVTTGSQQGLFLSAMTLIDEGDYVVAENPSYLGAFNACRAFGAKFCGVDVDDEGIDLEQLKAQLESNPKMKLLYVIPNYQNPTGKSWSEQRRKDFMALVANYSVYVIEDNPYGEVCFDGNSFSTLKSLDTRGQVIYLGSFSKILSPGLRVAWVCADSEIIEKMELVKQGVDLQSSEFTQHQVYAFIKEGKLQPHIEKINAVYGKKCALMLQELKKIDIEGFKISEPTGGMFIWAELPEYMDSDQLVDAAIDYGVAYIPGKYFFVDENVNNSIRLNFTTVSEEQIVSGVKLFKDFLHTVQR
jgi:2-aminoadipate transaminase